MKKGTFIFHNYWMDFLGSCSYELVYEILDAINEYSISNTVIGLSPIAEIIFSYIKIDMDKDAVNYRYSCKREQGKSYENCVIRNSSEMREWRNSVLERDKHTCQQCGCPGGELHAHHIKPFSSYPELRFDVNNGITLCRQCHSLLHKIEREWSNRNNE